jgi:hypothetical protein
MMETRMMIEIMMMETVKMSLITWSTIVALTHSHRHSW